MMNAFSSGGVSSAPAPAFSVKEEIKRVEPLSFGGLPAQTKAGAPAAKVGESTDSHLAKANNLLAELDREEKSGFNLRQDEDEDSDFDSGKNKA